MISTNNRFLLIALFVGSLLLIPLIAMKFDSGVNWSVFDFIVATTLLSGTGLLMDWVWRKVKNLRSRLIYCGLLLVGLILIWAELAVGIFGTPFAGS